MTSNKWNENVGPHGYRDGQVNDPYEPDDPNPFTTSVHGAKSVADLHLNSDLNSSQQSQHHTLGTGRNQASPGNHIHDGGGSLLIPSLAAFGNWTTYINNVNAASSWFGSVTNPVISNGTITGKYTLLNKICFVRLTLVFGSTTTQGSGDWSFVIPFTAIGTDSTFTGSVATYAGGFWTGSVYNSGSRFSFASSGAATFWKAGVPATFGTGNTIVASFFYELA